MRYYTYAPRLQVRELPAPLPDDPFLSPTFPDLSVVRGSRPQPLDNNPYRLIDNENTWRGKQTFIKSRFKPGYIGLLKKKQIHGRATKKKHRGPQMGVRSPPRSRVVLPRGSAAVLEVLRTSAPGSF